MRTFGALPQSKKGVGLTISQISRAKPIQFWNSK